MCSLARQELVRPLYLNGLHGKLGRPIYELIQWNRLFKICVELLWKARAMVWRIASPLIIFASA